MQRAHARSQLENNAQLFEKKEKRTSERDSEDQTTRPLELGRCRVTTTWLAHWACTHYFSILVAYFTYEEPNPTNPTSVFVDSTSRRQGSFFCFPCSLRTGSWDSRYPIGLDPIGANSSSSCGSNRYGEEGVRRQGRHLG